MGVGRGGHVVMTVGALAWQALRIVVAVDRALSRHSSCRAVRGGVGLLLHVASCGKLLLLLLLGARRLNKLLLLNDSLF